MDNQEQSDSSFVSSPDGFVGWVGNLGVLWKMYLTNISEETIDQQYTAFFGRFKVDCLQLGPKKHFSTLQEVFFKTNNSFHHHFNYEDFDIKRIRTDTTLLDVINFIPSSYLPNLVPNATEQGSRKSEQHRLISSFTAAFKGYHSAMVFKQKKDSHGAEQDDKEELLQSSMAFSYKDSVVIEDGGISGEAPFTVPSGNIDIIILSDCKSENVPYFVAIHYTTRKVTEGKITFTKLLSASVKANRSFSMPGSERQAIVELLSLSQSMLQSNPSMEVFTILKACKSAYQPYFYFPKHDLLLTCESLPLHGSVMGSFMFFLILHNIINTKIAGYLATEDKKSGWSNAVQSARIKYYNHILLQHIPTKRAHPCTMPEENKHEFQIKEFSKLL